MGRGRQKAKQTKVARKLKYTTPDTDYQALERELKAGKDESQFDRRSSDYYDDDEERAREDSY